MHAPSCRRSQPCEPPLSLPFAALALLPFAAHGDTIDDFTFTDGTHTIQYSLPATNTTMDFNLFSNFSASASATIDGVSGYTVGGQYFDFPFNGLTAVLNVPSAVFGVSQLQFYGPFLTTFITVPANNPFPYLPYNVVSTFVPTTYTLHTQYFGLPAASDTYTLTITTEASSVPEPSTLVLLATGSLAALSRRFRRA